MKHSMTRLLVGVAAALALSAGHAAAKPEGAAPLSPYVGQCVALIMNSRDFGVRGVLQTAGETHAKLDLEGYPVVAFMSHVSYAVVDADDRLGLCTGTQSTNATELLERFGLQLGS